VRPSADVVPPEVAGSTTTRCFAPGHRTSTDTGVMAAKNPLDVMGVRVQRRRDLRRELADVVEEITHAPHEDPRVPQVAVAPHLLGAACDPVSPRSEPRGAFRARFRPPVGYIAEARVGARRARRPRSQHALFRRTEQRARARPGNPVWVADRPVGRGSRSSRRRVRRAARSPARPSEGGRPFPRPRLGHQIRHWNVGKKLVNRRHQWRRW
jgi:hypothetical protein